ncbi:sigma-70 family RNA polymerase sigma factor [Streptomyces sp. NPDC050418]|uniref:sigma-70 family RNA polymerase sigma factor n=1 Tax=Streptomyces sp. NPDC050418 TaxID=3365612 RepID=UPI003793F98A
MTTALEHPTRTPEQELAELQEAHGRALFGFLLSLTYGDRQRAEDLVQETLVRAWQHPEALRTDHESMRPWLFTVGRRLAIDARRARRARPTEVGAEGIEHVLLGVVGDGHEEHSVMALDVREALTTLRREHRDVLVQLYYRGQSVTEAAQALGIPAGTVKSRSYYALRRLKTVLPGYGAGPAH